MLWGRCINVSKWIFFKKTVGQPGQFFWPLLNPLLPLHLMVGWLMIRWPRMASCTWVIVGCWVRWCWWLDHVFLIMKQVSSGFLWKMQDSKSWKRKQAPVPKGFLYCNCYCSIGHIESYGQPPESVWEGTTWHWIQKGVNKLGAITVKVCHTWWKIIQWYHQINVCF